LTIAQNQSQSSTERTKTATVIVMNDNSNISSNNNKNNDDDDDNIKMDIGSPGQHATESPTESRVLSSKQPIAIQAMVPVMECLKYCSIVAGLIRLAVHNVLDIRSKSKLICGCVRLRNVPCNRNKANVIANTAWETECV
jgi:hypothetical protein